MESLQKLKARLGEIHNIKAAVSVLQWDRQTYMPPGGTEARAEQVSTLSRLAHEMFTSDETGRLLEAAETEAEGLDYDSDDAAFLRVARRDYDFAVKVPPTWVAEMSRTASLAHSEWVKAKDGADYSIFKPWLVKILDLNLRKAEYLGYEDCPYDALLDEYEPGMKTAQVREVFDDLRRELIPFVQAIFEQVDSVDDSFLHDHFDIGKQEQFTIEVIEQIGYDFKRGRQDVSVHPFTISFSINDVRITTKYELDFLTSAIFSSIHEAGHAMYEQGIAQELEGTILASGTSLGVHESQSRLWENIVGRSREFWRAFYPRLRELFPERLGDVDLEAFYRAVNKVKSGYIRVDADEVSYNLHIMLRFDLENRLIDGDVTVDQAPDAWNAGMEELLGLTPPNDSLGILQDIHWSMGAIGYFPTYSLGNLISAQLYDRALAEHPEIPSEIERGEFGTLLEWMRENVHRHGRKYMPAELVKRATGGPIQIEPFMAYLRRKFGEIYEI